MVLSALVRKGTLLLPSETEQQTRNPTSEAGYLALAHRILVRSRTSIGHLAIGKTQPYSVDCVAQMGWIAVSLLFMDLSDFGGSYTSSLQHSNWPTKRSLDILSWDFENRVFLLRELRKQRLLDMSRIHKYQDVNLKHAQRGSLGKWEEESKDSVAKKPASLPRS